MPQPSSRPLPSPTGSPLTRRALLRAIASAGTLAVSGTLLGCSPGSAAPPANTVPANAVGPTDFVMVIRHGEKPDDDNEPPGVDVNGYPADDSSLTRAGWDRARRLAELFAPTDDRPTRAGLVRPKVIYAAGAREEGKGLRTRQTVMPLAQRLDLPTNTEFGKGDEKALVEDIVSRPGPTLVCWQHSEIPTIAEAFGTVTPDPPGDWPSERYDVIWTFARHGDGWEFAQLSQLLLPGDRPTVIED